MVRLLLTSSHSENFYDLEYGITYLSIASTSGHTFDILIFLTFSALFGVSAAFWINFSKGMLTRIDISKGLSLQYLWAFP